MAVVLTSANTGEREGVRLVFKERKLPRLAKTLADQGFDGKEFFAWVFSSFGWVLEISDTKSVDCRKNLWVVFGY